MRGLARFWIALLLVVSLLAAACSSAPPTADEGAADTTDTTDTTDDDAAAGDQGEATAGVDNSAALEAVYAAVEGLSGEERTNTLLELAAEEEALNVYGSTNFDDAGPLFDEFEDLYDLEPSYFRASSSDVLRRILQEVDANFAGNDVVMANGPELVVLDQEGLLSPLNSPTTEDIVDAGVFDNWSAMYMNTFIAGWNTNTTPSGVEADNWVDFLNNFEGELALELGDWDWFATLTKNYFTTEAGMTEEEVVELFKQVAARSRVVDGHTLMAELVVAGEFDAATSLYHHRVAEFITEGAPLAWEAPIRPLVIRPNGIGIMRHAQSPATALLWVEFVLTRGQEIFAENFRGPASSVVAGGLPEEYEPILVDLDAITSERDKWESLWAEIVEQSGTEPIGD